jgi:nucleoside-diphosphate-sugar epimerase
MTDERFLVTGCAGCIGAWTVARLVDEGVDVVALDVSEDDRRLRLLLDDEDRSKVRWVRGDIRDFDTVARILDQHRVTHIVHLAALQIPFCKADPVLGSQVNVTGTVNIFEATRRTPAARGLAYASSVAVFGPSSRYAGGRATDDSPLLPTTLYGAFKQANEATAHIYAADWDVGSVGIRPCVVYGPGRDQGMTSDPTKAMLAAAAGHSSHIAFGGSTTFHHADDVAAAFIASARLEATTSYVHNLGGVDATIPEVAGLIETSAVGRNVKVTYEEADLPIPSSVDGTPLDDRLSGQISHRPLRQGITETIAHFERLLADGRLSE